jgi:hypothetical protein
MDPGTGDASFGENEGLKGKMLWEGKKGGSFERFLSPSVSFFDDRFNRANLKTASTFGTFLFVDHIGFPFFNGFGGAFFRAGPASHTFF